MIKFTYALILFFTVIICFVASFDKRVPFHKHFDSFIKSAIVVAIPFIIWDMWFTHLGVWWFDFNYTTGINIIGLPLEECLFFICIPFSCVFTYFCITKFFDLKAYQAFNTIIVFVTVIVCAVVGLIHIEKWYTMVTAVVTISTVLYLHFYKKVYWITEASLVYTLLMLGFFPVNGVLTGTGLESPIVNYNPQEFMGFRILTIPIEDAVYGYAQFLWVLFFFKHFESLKQSKRQKLNPSMPF